MKYKAFLALLAMSVALMLPMMAAATQTDPLVLTVTGADYHEEVTDYKWAAAASVMSGGSAIYAVNLAATGQVVLDYDLLITRTAEPVLIRHGFRGAVEIDNNTAAQLPTLPLLLKLYAREDDGDWTAIDQSAVTVSVDATGSTTVHYDFEIDIKDFNGPEQGSFELKVEASALLAEVPYEGATIKALAIPAELTAVQVNQKADVEADFVWLRSGIPIDFPTGVSVLTLPQEQRWEDLTTNVATLELKAWLLTNGYSDSANLGQDALRLDVTITPSDSTAFPAYSLPLLFNLAGNHSVHFSVTGGHGSVAAWMGSSELHLGATIPAGSQLRFVASPEDGYKVKEWKINNVVQTGTGLALEINLTANTVVTVEFAPLTSLKVYKDDDADNGNPAATAIANKILKENNSPHRIATTSLKKNGKATYVNLISEVAKQNRGNSFMGVDRSNQAAFYNAVYAYLKQLGAKLP